MARTNTEGIPDSTGRRAALAWGPRRIPQGNGHALLAVDTVLLRTAGTLLGVVALSKILSAFSGVRYLAEPDPVISFLSNRLVLLIAGHTEALFAALLLLAPRSWYSRWGLLALCGTFAEYRVGLSFLDVHPPCRCLGRASDWLHITPRQADSLALGLLVVLGCIGVISLAVHHKVDSVSNAALRGGTREVL